MQEEIARHRETARKSQATRGRRVAEVDRKIAGMMRAIEDGLYEPQMKGRLAELKVEKAALAAEPAEAANAALDVLLHPSLPALYRRKVEELERVLEGADRAEAMELIRSMIDRVELRPRTNGKGLDAMLHGELAAILAACAEAESGGPSVKKGRLAAGTGKSTVGGCGGSQLP